MSLRDLYQEMIVDHGKTPRNFGSIDHATHSHAGNNPLCGDNLVVYLQLQDGKVADIRFEATGCAISVASASMMSEVIKGKTLEEVNELFELFHVLVTEGKGDDEKLGKLAAFSGVAEFPVRVKCASLAWHTLKAAYLNDPDPVTTE